MASSKLAGNAKTLALYSWGHALVDAACAALVIALVLKSNSTPDRLLYVVLYNVLAFGLQVPFGFLADLKNAPSKAGALGCFIIPLGILSAGFPLAAVTLVAIGNALFHIGGGVVSLRMGKGDATIPGIFVAPGAIGLFLGGFLSNSHISADICFIALLLITGVGVYLTKFPAPLKRNSKHRDYVGVAMLFLLLTVVSRSLVGFGLSFTWKEGFVLSLALVSGIALGKAAGGILADRFGWKRVTVSALLLSAPMLAFGPSNMALGIVGIFLFNFSMPITLVAIARMLQGWEGFAFGLTTLALVAGALLAFAGGTEFLKGSSMAIFVIILASAAALYYGLNRSRS
jgi:MFS transporter, FSR family, fosmidomycin resistance protein